MSNPNFCTQCNAAVRLEEQGSGEYILKCACNEKPIELSGLVPKEWTQ